MTKRTDLTLDELILLTLNRIRDRFYAQTPARFFKQKRHLLKAITRFGYECRQRNWHFDAEFIFREISRLLYKIEKHKADIEFLPAYLDSCLTLHIGQRAEELSAENKRINNVTGRVTDKLKVNPAAEEDLRREKRERVTEALSTIFRTLSPRPAKKQGQQLNFFKRL